ncbi:DNA helicase RecQ [Selenihalanaerobacter shriftii]|uniref:DNA helicase RecQ n=1 Tax=Selenihalanaerobacter shriftii TaxID=142842 RepID=A0A1T4NHL6_9FIRM|nr:DNA helicase RecQ [Selenihalanaerobacter shriftii]SJZ78258.1 ATP-dependent DNA helicase, RecQ-like [Selenihalanaerobacter shriftii]
MLKDAKKILSECFGYESFREGQADIIENILAGNHTMGIMPTGGGKSICFQIPSICLSGTTIVISPLISLMKDQIDSLQALGVGATFINSSLDRVEIEERLEKAKVGQYDLLYIAPERLNSKQFLNMLKSLEVSLVVVDEAHCISQWGHDFRPAYRKIPNLIDVLVNEPTVTAFTATATEVVREDISEILGIDKDSIFITSFDRPNLTFKLVKGEDKRDFIEEFLTTNSDDAGIIYAATRKEVDNLHSFLQKKGFAVGKYHAGLGDKVRQKTQDDFLYDKIEIVVATNAFGMGIDKSNVRYVIHHNMPKNLEAYYQEAGRAGRDGEPSECVLLFSPSDTRLPRFFIEKSNLSPKKKNHEYKKLRQMIDYCHTSKCLRQYILEYFGEKDVSDECSNCSNCDENIEFVDITTDAQKVFSCVYKMDERYGISVVAKVLRGSKSKRILKSGLDELSTYGIMNNYTIKEIKNLIKFLVAEKYISLTEGKYPVTKLTEEAAILLQGKGKVQRKIRKETKKISKSSDLFDELRNLRKVIAEEENVPPFVIFNDSTLRDMVDKLPTSAKGMTKIKGVGVAKLKKYGYKFINKIKEHIGETNSKRRVKNSSIKVKNNSNLKSHVISYNLYKEGKALEDIAELRGLALSTVKNHMIKAAKDDLEVDLKSLVPKQHQQLILDKIEEVGMEKLSPIKNALSDDVTYFHIKAMISHINLNS